ncbi:hypothetical protein F511_13078 [Dorcoceras hygrometricum]|uniref:Uncharacterized protein n=1 Tax=Dorcoceras hygrometricum TaxID=472368 RepID=A0A2Z7DED9_9LAMI|nr:hypothetical protein F511_13078 [Dorcoceras hygrometricum]
MRDARPCATSRVQRQGLCATSAQNHDNQQATMRAIMRGTSAAKRGCARPARRKSCFQNPPPMLNHIPARDGGGGGVASTAAAAAACEKGIGAAESFRFREVVLPKSSSYAQHIELRFRAGILNPVLV